MKEIKFSSDFRKKLYWHHYRNLLNCGLTCINTLQAQLPEIIINANKRSSIDLRDSTFNNHMLRSLVVSGLNDCLVFNSRSKISSNAEFLECYKSGLFMNPEFWVIFVGSKDTCAQLESFFRSTKGIKNATGSFYPISFEG